MQRMGFGVSTHWPRLGPGLALAVLLVALLGVISASATSIPSNLAVATSSPSVTQAAVPGGPLTSQAAAELARMPAGSHVVACSPQLAKYDGDSVVFHGLGFLYQHPGFGVLSDGHCVIDPTAPSNPPLEPPIPNP